MVVITDGMHIARPRKHSSAGSEAHVTRPLPLDKYTVKTHVVRGMDVNLTTIAILNISWISCSERGSDSSELAPYCERKLWPKAIPSRIL
jgi:hypothetical protein